MKINSPFYRTFDISRIVIFDNLELFRVTVDRRNLLLVHIKYKHIVQLSCLFKIIFHRRYMRVINEENIFSYELINFIS